MENGTAMRHRKTLRSRLLLGSIIGALISACSTAPAGTSGSASRAAPPVTEMPAIVCGESSIRLDLQGAGLPTRATPLDVALSADRIWVLAEGRTLLEVPRDLQGSTRILHGRADGPDWSALAVDRSDGSLWIVSRQSFDLLRFDPKTGATRRVTVRRATGPGGFHDIAVGDGVLYVAPTCSEHGVWTVDPAGDLLDRSLTGPDENGPISLEAPETAGCEWTGLATGPGGSVYATHRGDVLRAEAGGWQEVPELTPTSFEGVALQGVDAGTSHEVWFYENARNFFFVRGGPAWMGGHALTAARDRRGSIVFTRAPDGRLQPHLERCYAWPEAVASDEAGYAIVTDRSLIVGR